MKTAYRCRAYPDQAQQQRLNRTLGCVRVVWNQTLAARHARWHAGRTSTSYAQTDAALTLMKQDPDLAFLTEVSSVPLQQALRHQHQAFTAFFAKRARYPRFKSRRSRQSAHYTRSAFSMRGGELRLASKDETDAAADFDAAMKVDPGVAASVGRAYVRAGLYEAAVGDFDRWIAAHPRNEDAAGALAARCRARAMWGQQLDKALGDCNQSLGYRPGDAETYASRGLVKLRLGQLDAAIGDFNTAVHIQPAASWALYGRGIAELRKGDKPKGDADMAAATAITPGLAEQAAKVGIAP